MGGQTAPASRLTFPMEGVYSGDATLLTINCANTGGHDDAANGHIVAVRVN